MALRSMKTIQIEFSSQFLISKDTNNIKKQQPALKNNESEKFHCRTFKVNKQSQFPVPLTHQLVAYLAHAQRV
jgi:hypothetical protein